MIVSCEGQPSTYQLSYRYVQMFHKGGDVKYKPLC